MYIMVVRINFSNSRACTTVAVSSLAVSISATGKPPTKLGHIRYMGHSGDTGTAVPAERFFLSIVKNENFISKTL